MNMTVGAWAVNIIDIAPNQSSTGFVYGIYNGVLNVIGSAVFFAFVFMGSMLFVVDRTSYTALVNRAQLAREDA